MKIVILETANKQDFFRTEKALAHLAVACQAIPEERTLRFQDPADLLRLLTARQLEVFRSVKGAPCSITIIAERLHRDRSAFNGDVFQLLQAGLVAMKTWMLAGRGHTKETRAAAVVMSSEALVM
jgi:predicted transcriptional regulator